MPNSFLSRIFSYGKHKVFVCQSKFAKSEFTKCAFSAENLGENARKVWKCLCRTKFCRKFASENQNTLNVMKELEIVKEYLKVYLSDRKRIFNEKPEEICVLECGTKFWLIRVVHQGEDFSFFSVWTCEEDSAIV